MKPSDLPPGVSINNPHINPPAPKSRRRNPNTGQLVSGKVNAYVRAHFKHVRLAVQYQARIDALLPLKRRVMAADTDVKIRHQRMTGSQLGEAQRIINGGSRLVGIKGEHRPAPAVAHHPPTPQEAAQ